MNSNNPKDAKEAKVEAEAKAKVEAEALAKSLGQPLSDQKPAEQNPPDEKKPEQPSQPTEQATMEAIIKNLPDGDMKNKLVATFSKVLAENEALRKEKELLERTKTQAIAWTSFRDWFTKECFPNQIQPKLKELGLDTANKRLVVTFPDGKTAESSGSSKNGDGKREQPAAWGKGIALKEGGAKTIEYDSPKKMAESFHLQIEGRRDMVQVFEEPVAAYTKEEAAKSGFVKVSLPKVYKIKEAIRGKHLMVEVLDKPAS